MNKSRNRNRKIAKLRVSKRSRSPHDSVKPLLIPIVLPIEVNSEDEIKQVDSLLRQGATAALLLWLFLLVFVHWLVPHKHHEYLEGTERNANVLAVVVLFVTNLSRMVPFLLRDNGLEVLRTGLLSASLTTQIICMVSIAMMAFSPTPVIIDHVTGIRVHMVRWVEWTSLAFLMTFMTEAIDIPSQPHKPAHIWKHSLAMLLSTSCGFVLPFCQTIYSFVAVLIICAIFYSSIFVRLYERYQRFYQTECGVTVKDRESNDRVRISLRLLETCAVLWTFLVIVRLSCIPLFLYAPLGSIWASPALPSVFEAALEITSKVWYMMLILEVHEMVFDKNTRLLRRLEELRMMMTAVWGNSSDVIALIVQENAVVSPTFLRMERMMHQTKHQHDSMDYISSTNQMKGNDSEGGAALVFTFETNSKSKDFILTSMDLSKPMTWRGMESGATAVDLEDCHSTRQPLRQCRNIVALANLLQKALATTETESLLLHDFYQMVPGEYYTEKSIQFEAKVTKLDTDEIVVVLRDISERSRILETEKKLAIELTERKLDAQVNRFTRHEVKNGLLAAIGLVGTVRETIDDEPDGESEEILPIRMQIDPNASDNLIKGDFTQNIYELDATLREVLDTVLSEAMARDVIHEIYEPRREPIEIESLLANMRRHGDQHNDRFPLQMIPVPLPPIVLDPQLLRYIHRNAVSNACKYGKAGGVVKTIVMYDSDINHFQMKVINLPGAGHSDLLFLSKEERDAVFLAGTRLHKENHGHNHAHFSAGDGAWIMQKCATVLNGKCSIAFEPSHTTFVLEITSVPAFSRQDELLRAITCPFHLPGQTRETAIDESDFQRK
jgi:signal transduction histidine kinase